MALAAGFVPSALADTATPVTVEVSGTTVGRPIAPGFVGLSIEFPAMRTYTGLDPSAINPVFVQLVKNLAPGEAPVVRIGGNSTDATWIPARGVHPTPGIHSTITPRFLALVKNFAEESDGADDHGPEPQAEQRQRDRH